MAKELRIGIIGYGQMGRIHTYAYRTIPIFYDGFPAKITLVGVCDQDTERAKKGVEQGGFQFWCTDYRELIDRKDIDVVNVCTPNSQHYAPVIAALQSGKHVYCEKPLAYDTRQAEEIVRLAEQSAVKHQVTSEYRFIPAIMKAKELIARDYVGRLFHFRGVYLHSGYIDPHRPLEWRLRKEIIGGGVLMDLGPHLLDIMMHLVGEVAEVMAVQETFFKERPLPEDPSRKGPVEVEDAMLLLLRFKNGGLGSAEFSRVATGAEDEMRFEIHGQKGALRFNLMEPNWLGAFSVTDPKGEQGFKKIGTVQKYPPPAVSPAPKFSIGWVRSHVHAQFSFLEAIVHDRPASPSFREGLKLHRLMETAYRSAETKTWIEVPA